VGGKEQAENLQAGLRAESGEAIGGSGNQQGIRASHVSIFAEIQNDVKAYLRPSFSGLTAS